MEKNCFTLSNSQPGISSLAVLEIMLYLVVVFLVVVFLSHYAKHLIVAVSIFPIESAELSVNARWIVFTSKIFIYQKYFKVKSLQSVLQINTMSWSASNHPNHHHCDLWLVRSGRPGRPGCLFVCLFVVKYKQTLITNSRPPQTRLLWHGGILSNGNFTFLKRSSRVKTTTSTSYFEMVEKFLKEDDFPSL